MPSTLLTVRDTIVALVEAITPYDDATASYHYWRDTDGKFFLDGASFHRNFVFHFEKNVGETDFGSNFSLEAWTITMRLRENIVDKGPGGAFDHLATEGIQVKRVINEDTNWPIGIDFVWCDGFEVERLDPTGNYNIVFTIQVRTQES